MCGYLSLHCRLLLSVLFRVEPRGKNKKVVEMSVFFSIFNFFSVWKLCTFRASPLFVDSSGSNDFSTSSIFFCCFYSSSLFAQKCVQLFKHFFLFIRDSIAFQAKIFVVWSTKWRSRCIAFASCKFHFVTKFLRFLVFWLPPATNWPLPEINSEKLNWKSLYFFSGRLWCATLTWLKTDMKILCVCGLLNSTIVDVEDIRARIFRFVRWYSDDDDDSAHSFYFLVTFSP